ncbi:MAG: HEPN domain-containing protein [Fibrobacterales bacterium]
MEEVKIPLFIKSMGHRIIAYILNVSEENAEDILNSKITLTKCQINILDQFIDICRELRMQGIDSNDVDFSVFHRLPKIFIDGKHLFNLWHEQMGGEIEVYDNHDPIVKLINRIASMVYPLFLIVVKNNGSYFNKLDRNIGTTIYSLPEYKLLCKQLMEDEIISSIFDKVGENDIDTYGSYRASTGQGGGLQLASLPSMILVNSFELMRMRGHFSLEELANAAEYTISTMRHCIKGGVVEVPVFLGFNNLSMDDIGNIETDFGIIRPAFEGMSELAPNRSPTTNINGKKYQLSFVLESTYSYKINFNSTDQNEKWPKELDQARSRLERLTENLSLCFSLACSRTPPVGITRAWTMVFDPFSHGASLSWNSNPRSPVNHHILQANEEREELVMWCNLVRKTKDEKIRLAIRRILSAINNRIDPIDGFIDTIIAWENLFGGNAELSFRISISIAKLLGKTEEDRSALHKLVVEYYNIRSKLVHGVKDLTWEQAIEYRDKSLDVALKAIRTLYKERVDLIQDTNRSKILALT